jgi:methionine-rich copper-binding protein CopC
MRLPIQSLVALVLSAAMFLPGAPAMAHAILVQSSPAAEGAVAGPSVAFELHFNSRIDPARSALTLTRPDHTKATLAIETDGPSDELKAKAELPPGSYSVRWQVLAVDGHITRGDLPFTVSGN